MQEELRQDVLKFLERGDDSTTLPGKHEAKKDGKELIKKYRAYSRVGKDIGIGSNQLRLANASKSPIATKDSTRAAKMQEELRTRCLKILGKRRRHYHNEWKT